jgi:uncharacterized membrane protein
MATWTNKHWGALIGALILFSMFLIGFEETLVVVLFGVIGYFIGKYLDGEIDPRTSALAPRAASREIRVAACEAQPPVRQP